VEGGGKHAQDNQSHELAVNAGVCEESGESSGVIPRILCGTRRQRDLGGSPRNPHPPSWRPPCVSTHVEGMQASPGREQSTSPQKGPESGEGCQKGERENVKALRVARCSTAQGKCCHVSIMLDKVTLKKINSAQLRKAITRTTRFAIEIRIAPF
jgi:hypothetical protein